VQEWNLGSTGGQFGLALITFLYVDILDCTGTLYGMARFAGLIDPNTGDFEGSNWAFTVDSICCSISSLFGLPPVTAFVESGAGISEGGKTGLTAMVTGICFLISVFFAPIFASIPSWATGCVLVLVGSMMTASVVDVNWRYLGDAVPAFLTITLMPFTYSIADGLIGGICSYLFINTVVWLIKAATRGKLVPPNYEEKEHWEHPKGGVAPVWAKRLFQGKRDFWREEDVVEAVSHKEEPVEPKTSSGQEPNSASDGVEPGTGDKVIKMS
jgi:adenine/guanine/hypoxanthine permease